MIVFEFVSCNLSFVPRERARGAIELIECRKEYMWKLKVAEGQGPWLCSTNNFIGRQIWEFDSDAGTPEEREAVAKARDDYQKNRSRVHPSGDVLMRMQLKKENSNIDLSIPPMRLGGNEQVNYEAVTTALKKAVRLSCAIQSKDGHWPAENSGPLILMPPMVSTTSHGCNEEDPQVPFEGLSSLARLKVLSKLIFDDRDCSIFSSKFWDKVGCFVNTLNDIKFS
ncbi:hypothetical protein RHMOL_Rhmol02G0263500 [Rhododendron molle]|uniref:Uncharacterized protein n=1 Tax=Rhododendron molle TaxID=49168 RepID=A0ACC0PUT2_RHOML|nr:hypothetical protein RHMOL_Rhmol02G0263500 [Rhododendron molle]